jgi:hypothetical protein
MINYGPLPANFSISYIPIGEGVGSYFTFYILCTSNKFLREYTPPRSWLGTGASSEAQLSSHRVKVATAERISGGGYVRKFFSAQRGERSWVSEGKRIEKLLQNGGLLSIFQRKNLHFVTHIICMLDEQKKESSFKFPFIGLFVQN